MQIFHKVDDLLQTRRDDEPAAIWHLTKKDIKMTNFVAKTAF